MKKSFFIIITLFYVSITAIVQADVFLHKKVFNFTSSDGVPVYTDKEPEDKPYKTAIVKAIKSASGTYQIDYSTASKKKTVKIKPKETITYKKRAQTKEHTTSLKTCKHYKSRWQYFADKMKAGYKVSEYQHLEDNRVKYRQLLFKNCNNYDLF